MIGIQDRFTRGFLSGLIAWFPALIINWGSHYLNLSKLRWSDFMGIMIYGHQPENILENLFALGGVAFFISLLGTGFAYLSKVVTSGTYIFKGWVYGVTLWFMFYVITVLFKVPGLVEIPLSTAFLNFAAASVWGLGLAITLRWLDNKQKLGGLDN